MRFDVITLFPGLVKGPLAESILKRALDAGKIEVAVHDLRDWTSGVHHQADDTPFGGGDGMVMMIEPLARAIRAAREMAPSSPAVLLTPQGRVFNQELAKAYSERSGLILVCGHYAGVDERAAEMVDAELSIGDYVLSGGELAALVVIEAVARLIPGVLGNAVSPAADSFPARLEAPQYTRPAEYEGQKVPEVLTSGNHEKIRRWRKKESLRRTVLRRPDLIARYPLDEEERELGLEIEAELAAGAEPDPEKK